MPSIQLLIAFIWKHRLALLAGLVVLVAGAVLLPSTPAVTDGGAPSESARSERGSVTPTAVTGAAVATKAPISTAAPAATAAPLATATRVPSPTAAPTPTAAGPVEPVYLADYKPVSYSLGYGRYSVGTFAFTSDDPYDNIHTGDPIVSHETAFPHGIFGHAPSTINFDLPEGHRFEELVVTLGMVEHIYCGDGVIFSVLGDFEELYHSNVVHAWSIPLEVRVPITGVKRLSLKVDDGKADDSGCDWAIWGDPLLR